MSTRSHPPHGSDPQFVTTGSRHLSWAPTCLRGPEGICRHLRPSNDEQLDRGVYVVCAAFPDGIPDAILTCEVEHTTPHEGDRGIRYEPTP